MKPYRLFAFLAAALITAAFLAVMIANDLAVARQPTGAAVTATSAAAQLSND